MPLVILWRDSDDNETEPCPFCEERHKHKERDRHYTYDRYLLGPGCVLRGPAIVEEIDSTTVIHPGYNAQVDRFGNLIPTQI